MERKKILWLAGGIVGAGFCAAWPFRVAPSPAAPETERPRRAELPASPNLNPAENALAVSSTRPAATQPATVDERPAAPPPVESEIETPAVLPTTVLPPKESEPVAPNADAVVETTPEIPTFVVPSRAVNRKSIQTWRRHRIKDGDTLPKLAQTYLGDPAQHEQIFALNRDVLPDPEILPIGRWLRIPVVDDAAYSAAERDP